MLKNLEPMPKSPWEKMVLGADESFKPCGIGVNTHFFTSALKTKSYNNRSRRLDLIIDVIFFLNPHANPTTIQLMSNEGMECRFWTEQNRADSTLWAG